MSGFPSDLLISDYDYILPEEKIAKYPLAERDHSKLLVYSNNNIEESRYSEIASFLPSPATLIFNDSRVIEARILFQKESGGQIEIFCLEPHHQYPSIPVAMAQQNKVLWACLIGGASKWKPGQILKKIISACTLEARFIEKRKDDFIVEFSWSPADLSFAEIIHRMGVIPLPPYLKRHAELSDSERYQTLYASQAGSVAAPTAGLHFNKVIFQKLAQKGIGSLHLTLHVGAGTFMPVKTENLSDHHMHEEFIEVSAHTLKSIIANLVNPIIAVGTTSLRTLESLYWLGLKVSINNQIPMNGLRVEQDDPYTMSAVLSPAESLNQLLDWTERLPEKKLISKTSLFIVPGYSFKIVRGLITNFHQPQSTLLLLVAALIGPSWKSVYTWALNNDYRFLSYGDGCLFLPLMPGPTGLFPA